MGHEYQLSTMSTIIINSSNSTSTSSSSMSRTNSGITQNPQFSESPHPHNHLHSKPNHHESQMANPPVPNNNPNIKHESITDSDSDILIVKQNPPSSSSTIPEMLEDYQLNLVQTVGLRCTESNGSSCSATLLYPNRSALFSHLNRAHDAQPYKCRALGCMIRFFTLHNLTQHITSTHPLNQTVWHCDSCFKMFTRFEHVQQHIYRFHEVGVFRCPLVGVAVGPGAQDGCRFYSEVSRDVVYQHLVQKHPKEYADLEAKARKEAEAKKAAAAQVNGQQGQLGLKNPKSNIKLESSADQQEIPILLPSTSKGQQAIGQQPVKGQQGHKNTPVQSNLINQSTSSNNIVSNNRQQQQVAPTLVNTPKGQPTQQVIGQQRQVEGQQRPSNVANESNLNPPTSSTSFNLKSNKQVITPTLSHPSKGQHHQVKGQHHQVKGQSIEFSPRPIASTWMCPRSTSRPKGRKVPLPVTNMPLPLSLAPRDLGQGPMNTYVQDDYPDLDEIPETQFPDASEGLKSSTSLEHLFSDSDDEALEAISEGHDPTWTLTGATSTPPPPLPPARKAAKCAQSQIRVQLEEESKVDSQKDSQEVWKRPRRSKAEESFREGLESSSSDEADDSLVLSDDSDKEEMVRRQTLTTPRKRPLPGLENLPNPSPHRKPARTRTRIPKPSPPLPWVPQRKSARAAEQQIRVHVQFAKQVELGLVEEEMEQDMKVQHEMVDAEEQEVVESQEQEVIEAEEEEKETVEADEDEVEYDEYGEVKMKFFDDYEVPFPFLSKAISANVSSTKVDSQIQGQSAPKATVIEEDLIVLDDDDDELVDLVDQTLEARSEDSVVLLECSPITNKLPESSHTITQNVTPTKNLPGICTLTSKNFSGNMTTETTISAPISTPIITMIPSGNATPVIRMVPTGNAVPIVDSSDNSTTSGIVTQITENLPGTSAFFTKNLSASATPTATIRPRAFVSPLKSRAISTVQPEVVATPTPTTDLVDLTSQQYSTATPPQPERACAFTTPTKLQRFTKSQSPYPVSPASEDTPLPHKCPNCSLRFRHLEDQHAHLLEWHLQRPHRCAICGQNFKQADYLEKHRLIFHP